MNLIIYSVLGARHVQKVNVFKHFLCHDTLWHFKIQLVDFLQLTYTSPCLNVNIRFPKDTLFMQMLPI